MVTPFDDQGEVNFDSAVAVARYLVAHGSDGLVVGGSTGEGSALTDAERADLVRCVAETVTVPVVVGTTNANTAHSIVQTAAAQSWGAAGILATTPAYVRPSQAGIAAHLSAIAESTELPLMLYDIPARTGRKIASATVIELANRHENIVALKDASGDLPGAAQTVAALRGRLNVYSGDDSLTLPFMSVGAVGLVSVAAHWAGDELARMVRCAVANEWDEARALNARLAPSYVFQSSEAYPNPIPAKAALRALGLNVGQCRLPLGASDRTIDDAAMGVTSELVNVRD